MVDFVEVRLFEGSHPLYYLVIQRSHGKWPKKIDGLPINSMVIFHGYGTNNQRVYPLYRYSMTRDSHRHDSPFQGR